MLTQPDPSSTQQVGQDGFTSGTLQADPLAMLCVDRLDFPQGQPEESGVGDDRGDV